MAACQHCGETFTPGRAGTLYCSGKCRTAAQRARAKESQGQGLAVACVVCGQPFIAQRASAKYCSRACSQKAYRVRLLEWKRKTLGRRPG